MFRQNVENTGVSTFEGPQFPDPLWQFNTSGFTYSSPSIGDDVIYIASEQEMIALDLDGSERWSIVLSENVNIEGVEITGFVSSPAISNTGVVYVGSLDHNLYAVSPSGIVLARYDTGGQVFSSPTIGPDGTVYVGSRSGNVVALRLEGGPTPSFTEVWKATYSAEFFSSPALDLQNNLLIIGGTDNILYALDLNSGGFRWFSASTIQEEIVSSPAVSGGTVYVGSVDNRVYAFDAASGAPRWQQGFAASDIIVSSPAVSPNNNTVYAGSFDGNFYAINAGSGTQKWSFNAGNIIASSPAIDANGLIYITTLGGDVYALRDEGSQASVAWSYTVGTSIWASPSIGPGNILYVAASGSRSTPGRLQAIGQSIYEVDLIPGVPVAGENLTVNVRQTGSQAPVSVDFYYRSGRDTDYKLAPLTEGLVIPGTDITEDGFAYYVDGPLGTYPSVSPEEEPATRRVFSQRLTSQAELFPRRYKMVSVPFDLNDPSIESVLDDYGPYNPMNWRLLRWDGLDYREYPTLGAEFTPGEAFFLVTSTGESFDVQNTTSVDISAPFSIELEPGWNQVGSPFGFPVAWSSVIRNTTLVTAIAFYNGAEMIQDPLVVNALRPWEGYFVYNAGESPAGIRIPPVPFEDFEVQLEEEAGKNSQSARVQIIASLEDSELRDTQNWIGYHAGALDGTDPLDIIEAPPFGDHIRLTVGTLNEPYALNYKPFASEGSEWPLTLSLSSADLAPASQGITLSFEREPGFPEHFELALVDEEYGIVQPVVNGTATVSWEKGREMRSLRLLAGTEAYIRATAGDLPVAPTEFALSQNFPNPFTNNTRIPYQLSARSHVTLIIYNALGQEVQTLVETTQNPGAFDAVWDGRDIRGREVPSGVYFYRLVADGFQASGRMTVVR